MRQECKKPATKAKTREAHPNDSSFSTHEARSHQFNFLPTPFWCTSTVSPSPREVLFGVACPSRWQLRQFACLSHYFPDSASPASLHLAVPCIASAVLVTIQPRRPCFFHFAGQILLRDHLALVHTLSPGPLYVYCAAIPARYFPLFPPLPLLSFLPSLSRRAAAEYRPTGCCASSTRSTDSCAAARQPATP